jgi:hypothetical protein
MWSRDHTLASERVADAKSRLPLATMAPLIAPAEAPVTMANGEGPLRNAGTSAMRRSTPAW